MDSCSDEMDMVDLTTNVESPRASPTPKSKHITKRKTTSATASAGPSSSSSVIKRNEKFSLKQAVEYLILVGLTSVSLWESSMFKIKNKISELMNLEIMNLYFALKDVVNAISSGVVQSGDLSQDKLELLNERNLEYDEIMSYVLPTVDLLKNPTYSKQCVKVFSDLIADCLKSLNEINQPQKQNSNNSNVDFDHEMCKLFGQTVRPKSKTTHVLQHFQLRSEDSVRRLVTPGEPGKFLIKIELTDMDDLQGISMDKHWTKVWKKIMFVTNDEHDEDYIAINKIILKRAKLISEIKNVAPKEYEYGPDRSGLSRKRIKF